MSKGSRVRPVEIPRDKFESNWEKTFGKPKPPEPRPTEPESKPAAK